MSQRDRISMQVMRATILAIVALAMAGPVNAQGLPKDPGPARTVKLFNFYCLSQLPIIEDVANAAGFGEFAELVGEELQKYQPEVPADELRAWRLRDFGSEFILTTARSKPDAQFKKEVPEFANSKSVACSLIISSEDADEQLLKEMVGLVGREPDEAWDQGPLRVHAWTGKTDKLLIVVHYYAPESEGQNAILRATAFVKK
ncbi:MAG: hypothetical protein ACR2OF_07740 [Hyphomicrobium sp.]